MANKSPKIVRSLARIEKAQKDLSAATKSLSTKEYMQGLGQFAAGLIKKRTRLGDGVKSEGAHKEPLKPLSPGYQEARKNDPELSEFASPNKSNLTRTGQLLDSMTAKNATARTVQVGPSGVRRDGKTNEKIGEYVSKDRPFNNLSEIETKRVSDKIRLDAKAAIKKALKK